MKSTYKILSLLLIAIAGIAFMVVLFQLSENKARFNNSFIRRFPPHMALLSKTRSLDYNSYYFAGYGNGHIYLGNSTAPFVVTVLDSALKTVTVSKIKLDKGQEIGLPQLRVKPPYFYFYEGAKPYVYSGSTDDWLAKLQISKGKPFSQLQAINGKRFLARYSEAPIGENSVRICEFGDSESSYIGEDLLSGTNRDAFESDGYLAYDQRKRIPVYVCYYKNTFLTGNYELSAQSVGNTIDTVKRQRINTVAIRSKREKTFLKMPLLVNRLVAADDGWMYVNSQVIGNNEPLAMWKEASIIDIYALQSKDYVASLYVADVEEKKISSMIVDGNSLYAMSGSTIVQYTLDKSLYNTTK